MEIAKTEIHPNIQFYINTYEITKQTANMQFYIIL